MTDEHTSESGGDDNDVHAKNLAPVFVVVFAMLCALTGLSFWVAHSHLMDNRLVGWGAMMAVSVAKAMLVIMFFMHLWWERAWKYILTIPALIMGVLLVVLLIPDIGFRGDTYSNRRRQNAPVIQVDTFDGELDSPKH